MVTNESTTHPLLTGNYQEHEINGFSSAAGLPSPMGGPAPAGSFPWRHAWLAPCLEALGLLVQCLTGFKEGRATATGNTRKSQLNQKKSGFYAAAAPA